MAGNTIRMNDLPIKPATDVDELIGIDKQGQSVRLPNDGAKIGSLSDLVTEDKSNLVNAINEAYAHGGGGGGGGGSTIVVNNLTSTSTTAALSANQGRLLNENKIEKGGLKTINGQSLEGSGNIEIQGGGGSSVKPSTEVIDNLTSSSTTSALSANQGKVLKTALDNKMPADKQFKTIGGMSIFGTGNIPIGATGDLPTHMQVKVDLQPSAVGGDDNTLTATKYDVDIPAGTEIYIGACATTLVMGTTIDSGHFNKVRLWLKLDYEDGTTGGVDDGYWDDNINASTGLPTGKINFEEIRFTAPKRIVKVWGVAQANKVPNIQNPRVYVYHYENTVEEVSPWNGKRWLVIGDSINVDAKHMGETFLAEETSPYMVADKLGMLVFNCSIGGYATKQQFPVPAELQKCIDNAKAYNRQVPTFDVISVELGANNHGFSTAIAKSGTSDSKTPILYDPIYNQYKSDVFTVWADETETELADCPRKYLKDNKNASFCAELQMLHDMLRKIFPAAPILYHSTMKRIWRGNSGTNNNELDALNGQSLTMEAYCEAIKRVAINYGCPYVNLYQTCSPKTEMERALWYTPADDGVHPNANAHRYRVAPILLNQFREIAPYEGVIPESTVI